MPPHINEPLLKLLCILSEALLAFLARKGLSSSSQQEDKVRSIIMTIPYQSFAAKCGLLILDGTRRSRTIFDLCNIFSELSSRCSDP